MSYCTFKLARVDKEHGTDRSSGKYRRFLYVCGENKGNLIFVKQPKCSTAPLVTELMFDRNSAVRCLRRDWSAMLWILEVNFHCVSPALILPPVGGAVK